MKEEPTEPKAKPVEKIDKIRAKETESHSKHLYKELGIKMPKKNGKKS